jgi:hypothetical protein
VLHIPSRASFIPLDTNQANQRGFVSPSCHDTRHHLNYFHRCMEVLSAICQYLVRGIIIFCLASPLLLCLYRTLVHCYIRCFPALSTVLMSMTSIILRLFYLRDSIHAVCLTKDDQIPARSSVPLSRRADRSVAFSMRRLMWHISALSINALCF